MPSSLFIINTEFINICHFFTNKSLYTVCCYTCSIFSGISSAIYLSVSWFSIFIGEVQIEGFHIFQSRYFSKKSQNKFPCINFLEILLMKIRLLNFLQHIDFATGQKYFCIKDKAGLYMNWTYSSSKRVFYFS